MRHRLKIILYSSLLLTLPLSGCGLSGLSGLADGLADIISQAADMADLSGGKSAAEDAAAGEAKDAAAIEEAADGAADNEAVSEKTPAEIMADIPEYVRMGIETYFSCGSGDITEEMLAEIECLHIYPRECGVCVNQVPVGTYMGPVLSKERFRSYINSVQELAESNDSYSAVLKKLNAFYTLKDVDDEQLSIPGKRALLDDFPIIYRYDGFYVMDPYASTREKNLLRLYIDSCAGIGDPPTSLDLSALSALPNLKFVAYGDSAVLEKVYYPESDTTYAESTECPLEILNCPVDLIYSGECDLDLDPEISARYKYGTAWLTAGSPRHSYEKYTVSVDISEGGIGYFDGKISFYADSPTVSDVIGEIRVQQPLIPITIIGNDIQDVGDYTRYRKNGVLHSWEFKVNGESFGWASEAPVKDGDVIVYRYTVGSAG